MNDYAEAMRTLNSRAAKLRKQLSDPTRTEPWKAIRREKLEQVEKAMDVLAKKAVKS